ncbi:MAG: tRNA-dihydrouridine synthase family protein [Desulfobacterales bacterium]|nr:tRNA-dihydrouridine synthase family protein [Desulfobacterales bacterium]
MKHECREFLNTPLDIGGRRIDGRLVLAPMSGLGNVAFRELLAEYGGAALMFTEMCSAKTVPQENRHVSPVFSWRDAELPRLVCQIFGSEPETMAAAARRIESEGFFGVDLNFGCAIARICKRNCGAALLKSPERAVRIVEAVRRAVRFPVFVKFRTGWEDRAAPAVGLARQFEAAGADALTFHPRVAPDRRARPPRWAYIGRVKAAVSIPVFGNGNVFSGRDCESMMSQTDCDGVALGRAAVAKPWIFREIANGEAFGPEAYGEMLNRLIDLLEAHYDQTRAIRRFRKTVVYMAAYLRYGHAFNKNLRNAADFEEIRMKMADFCQKPPELSEEPNLNFF